jgi:hypothetical protein
VVNELSYRGTVRRRGATAIKVTELRHRLTRHRWEDNIKMDRKEKVCDDVDWIHLAQDRGQWRALVTTVISILFP